MISPLPAVLDAEGHTAPAGVLRIRVVECEPSTDQARVVIEHRAVEQPQAPGIDEYPRAVGALEHDVSRFGRVLPAKNIFEPRAAAGLHANAEANLAHVAFGQHFLDLLRCVFRDLNHRLIAYEPSPFFPGHRRGPSPGPEARR